MTILIDLVLLSSFQVLWVVLSISKKGVKHFPRNVNSGVLPKHFHIFFGLGYSWAVCLTKVPQMYVFGLSLF